MARSAKSMQSGRAFRNCSRMWASLNPCRKRRSAITSSIKENCKNASSNSSRRLAPIAQNHFAAGGPGGIDEALHFERGVHVGIRAIAVVGHAGSVEGLETGGQNYRADLDVFLPGLRLQVDGMALTAGCDAGLLAF